MDIYVLNGNESYGKKFIELCESVQLKKDITPEFLMDKGFTNYHKPTLYYLRGMNKKNYHVSFSISIDKKTMRIKSFDLLNEEILQPHRCNEYDYKQVEIYINSLIKKGVLERKVA